MTTATRTLTKVVADLEAALEVLDRKAQDEADIDRKTLLLNAYCDIDEAIVKIMTAQENP